MDPVMIEKLQAMKRYRKRSFVQRLTRCVLSICFTVMFLSCPLWLPKVHSWFVSFIFVSVGKLRAVILGPKCLFVICNVIAILLFGDSKRFGGVRVSDIYEEYARRNMEVVKVRGENRMRVKEERLRMEEMVSEEEEEEEEEEREETCLPVEELNRRVEDFIAQVNHQRRMEARMMLAVAEDEISSSTENMELTVVA